MGIEITEKLKKQEPNNPTHTDPYLDSMDVE